MQPISVDPFLSFQDSMTSMLADDGVIGGILGIAVILMTVKVAQYGAYKVLSMIDDSRQRKADEEAWYRHDNRE